MGQNSMLDLTVCKQSLVWLKPCVRAAYQRVALRRCRPDSHKVILSVETFMTFPFRLALVLKSG